MEIEIKSDTKLLEQLIKNIDKGIEVKVGVFDSSLYQEALQAEFGNPNAYIPELNRQVKVPARSFLVSPIEENLSNQLNIKEEDLVHNMEKIGKHIGEEAQAIVEAYFQNEGYGKWATNLPEWKEYKQTHGFDDRILHKTGKLSESIEYKVVK